MVEVTPETADPSLPRDPEGLQSMPEEDLRSMKDLAGRSGQAPKVALGHDEMIAPLLGSSRGELPLESVARGMLEGVADGLDRFRDRDIPAKTPVFRPHLRVVEVVVTSILGPLLFYQRGERVVRVALYERRLFGIVKILFAQFIAHVDESRDRQ